MSKNIPLYELRVDEDSEALVNAIAIVGDPAIQSNFYAFGAASPKKTFVFSGDEKRELIGAAMIPDLKILRVDPETGEEFNVTYSADTVRTVAQLFFKKNYQDKINIMNEADSDAKSFVFQSFIIDDEKGINSPKGLDLPDGSWVVGVKVQDDAVWQKVKSGEFIGFSVEGDFLQSGRDISGQFTASEINQLESLINEYNGLQNK